MKLYIKNKGKILGPLDWDRVLAFHDKGRFSSDTTVSKDKANWLPIEQVKQLSGQDSWTFGNNTSLSTEHNPLPQANLQLRQEEKQQEGYTSPMQSNMQHPQRLDNMSTQQPNTQQATQIDYMASNQPDAQQLQQAGTQQNNSNNNKIYFPIYLSFISLIIFICLLCFLFTHKDDSKKGNNSSTTELSTSQDEKTEDAPSLLSVSSGPNGDDENTEETEQTQKASPQEGSQNDEKEIQAFEYVITDQNGNKGNQQEGAQEKRKASQCIQGEIQIDDLLSFTDEPPDPNGDNGNHEGNNHKPDNEFPDAQGRTQTDVPQFPRNTPTSYSRPRQHQNNDIQPRYQQHTNKSKKRKAIRKNESGRNKAMDKESFYLPSAREQTSLLSNGRNRITEGTGRNRMTEGTGRNKLTEGTGRNKLTEGKNRNKIIKTTY